MGGGQGRGFTSQPLSSQGCLKVLIQLRVNQGSGKGWGHKGVEKKAAAQSSVPWRGRLSGEK